jgi:membrane protease subunit (stomatin/prohibitin family)
MGNDILMLKKTTETGVITNKSTIIVGPGQCAVIYDNGKIIDATAEEGFYTFDTSSSPSFFAGQFGAVFKEMWQRFTYGGGTSKQQAVFFFNIKEIIENKFGTKTPIMYQDWGHIIPNRMTGEKTPLSVQIRCFGNYTFKISNPALFMSEIAGIADKYEKSKLVEQMQSEVLSVFQNVTNELGTEKYSVRALEMPSHTDEIKEMMDQKVFDEPIRRRGISIVGFNVESVTLTDESQKKIDNYELSASVESQQGKLVSAYADAIKDAANNANGAANGFMGIGMMNMTSGGVMGGTIQNVWQNNTPQMSSQEIMQNYNKAQEEKRAEQPQPPVAPTSEEPKAAPTEEHKPEAPAEPSKEEWTCECGAVNTGKFCTECGKKKPEVATEKVCPKCGAVNSANSKFCNECGEKL